VPGGVNAGSAAIAGNERRVIGMAVREETGAHAARIAGSSIWPGVRDIGLIEKLGAALVGRGSQTFSKSEQGA
jgi:hypothetical protein